MSEGVNITANETTIGDVLSRKHRFEVPSYQRQYSWSEEQWFDLWEDIDSLENNEMHFLGSIVVISDSYDPSGSNVLQLVDGQQRLATVSILLCALRERYTQLGEKEKADLIHGDYLFDKDFDETQPKLQLGNLDNPDFLELLEKASGGAERNQLLEDAYAYFCEQTSDYAVDEVDQLRQKLLNHVSIVTIRSNSETSAFRLFESLNDRGLELSAVDLMKNLLASGFI